MRALFAIAVAAWPALSWAGDPFRDIPQVVSSAPVDGELSANGVPVKAMAVVTKLKPVELQRHLVKRMKEENLYIPSTKQSFQIEGVPQLTGYDGDAKVSYTAIFHRNGDGSTTVVLGVADLSQMPAGLLKPADGAVPVMPGAVGVLRSTDEGRQVVSYRVAGSASEVARFYDAVLTPKGLQRDGEGHWQGSGGELELTTQSADGGLTRVFASYRAAAK